MKRVIALLLILIMMCTMCGCGVNQKKADYLVNKFIGLFIEAEMSSDKFYNLHNLPENKRDYEKFKDNLDTKAIKNALLGKLEEISEKKNADELMALVYLLKYVGYKDADVSKAWAETTAVVIRNLQDSSDFETVFHFIRMLDNYTDRYKIAKEDAIREAFGEYLDVVIKSINNNSSDYSIVDYCHFYAFYLEDLAENEFVNLIDYFPYKEMAVCVKANGEKVIVKQNAGGYYDDKQSDYENEDYWYSPLDGKKTRSGSVGTYRVQETYLFEGDFMVRVNSKYWYDTPSSDPNNSLRASLNYKGNYVSGEYWDIQSFLQRAEQGETYYICDSDGDEMFFVLEKDRISILDSSASFSIAYS